MFGLFIFDEKPSVDTETVKAHLSQNKNIEGRFYVPQLFCSDTCSVEKGDSFYGILDDTTGYGGCIFIQKLETEVNNFLLQKQLHVKGDTTIDGNLKVGKDLNVSGKGTINQNLSVSGSETVGQNLNVTGTITGNSLQVSTIVGGATTLTFTLTAAMCGAIVGGASGTGTVVVANGVVLA